MGIQHSHGIACDSYKPTPLRTGYERVLAHRTGDLFAQTAKQNGKVTSVTPTGIIVEYEDGSTRGYELGRRFGNAGGLTIPQMVITELKEGQKFKVGDVISYNPGFFEKDPLDPSSILWKAGVLVKTVLLESNDTLEDSSAISERLAEQISTRMTKIKTVVLNFDQAVHKTVKVGESVKSDSILCIIENAVTADTGLFDTETIDTLKLLSSQTPLAKMNGVVERIEVFYHGDKEDMSDSIRALSNVSDKELSSRYKSFNQKAFTGRVDDSFKIDGDPLLLDTVAIRFYITGSVPAGIGD